MFKLTEALIDDIVFLMEDQNRDCRINTQTGVVEPPEKAARDSNEYIEIPNWTSADGFGLMERFTASLKNPPAQKALSAALNRGKGVFRAFKDELSKFPEVEKRWFVYKQNELKKAVHLWYEGLREENAVSKIGGEPEDSEELVDSDFSFELKNDAETLFAGAKSAGGKSAGKINAVFSKNDGVFVINEFFVNEEFRGLGLGKALLKKILEANPNYPVLIELPADNKPFERVLLREGFSAVMTKYVRR